MTFDLTLGIDASNIRTGGGLTHLKELLDHAEPQKSGFKKLVVWASSNTLDQLPEKNWLTRRNEVLLNGPLISRLLWQRSVLPKRAKQLCDLLFLPAGNAVSFGPCVSMCQNLLPFDPSEKKRYGYSRLRWRLELLRVSQCRSFRQSRGTIFLSEISRQQVENICGKTSDSIIISHGVHSRFRSPRPKIASGAEKLRLTYVSTVDAYKHQWNVVKAFHQLLDRGHELELELIGSGYGPAISKLQRAIEERPEYRNRIKLYDKIPYEELPQYYRDADIFVFASSCETFGMIVLEAMASGVPIACSSMSSMKEILGDTGLYFDPLEPASIATSLEQYISNPALREEMARRSWERSGQYSWERCAGETFTYFKQVADRFYKK